MRSPREAVQLYHVLRIDKELKPNDSFTAYKIDKEQSPNTLDIRISCTSVRQLRLSTNALMDSVALVVETIGAFGATAAKQDSIVASDRLAMADGEFELSGTGRAG
jgi:hypothetical protein